MGQICNCSKGSDHVLGNPGSSSTRNDKYRKFISFKDFKGFKHMDDITLNYELGETLGSGSFGTVKRARHIRGNVECAVKCIKKKEVQKHQILVDLMKNELQILESTVSQNNL
jgi:serine/threonine protein kinase